MADSLTKIGQVPPTVDHRLRLLLNALINEPDRWLTGGYLHVEQSGTRVGKVDLSTAAVAALNSYTSITLQTDVAATNPLASGNPIAVTDNSPITPVDFTLGGATLTSAPTIAAGRDGQLAIIFNAGNNSVTLQDEGVLSGSKLRLGETTRTLTSGASLTLVYSSTLAAWVEHGFNTLVTVTPAIDSFTVSLDGGTAASSHNAEVGSGSTTQTPTFALSYTGVPSAASISVTPSSSSYPATVSSPFTSLTAPSYTRRTSVDDTVTFAPTVTINGVSVTTPTIVVTYMYSRYVGAVDDDTTDSLNNTQMLALTPELSKSEYGTFEIDGSEVTLTEYIWYCYPSETGNEIPDGGFAITGKSTSGLKPRGSLVAGFTEKESDFSHTNAAGGEKNYRQYRSGFRHISDDVVLTVSSTKQPNYIVMFASGSAGGSAANIQSAITASENAEDGHAVISDTPVRTYTGLITSELQWLYLCHPARAGYDITAVIDTVTGLAIDGLYLSNVTDYSNGENYTEEYRVWRSLNNGILPTSTDVKVI